MGSAGFTRTPPPSGTVCRLKAAADFTIIAASGKVRDLVGWSPKDLVGRSLYEFVHPSDLSEMRRSHQEWLASPLRAIKQYRIRHKAGGYVWIESDRRGSLDSSGALMGAEAEWSRLDSIPEIDRLLSAIDHLDLSLRYQPVVDAQTGQLVQLEALVRWERDGVTVPPSEFIPLAEQTGVIRLITTYVLTKALEDHSRLVAEGIDVPIAVNISVRDLGDPLFAVEVLGKLSMARSKPSALVLEITESAVADTDEYVLTRVEQLAAAGLVIALDDFGAGRSTIARLATLPIRELKFDRSLTARPGENSELFRIFTALAEDRGIRLVAEGIETEAQLGILRALGIRWMQGFFFARPMPIDALASWMSSQPMVLPIGPDAH
ncbi:MAG TPA: EAL domain-containing protein [Candidatus Limnocylindria bacterium]|nr:EAL domain-containing protein [Candidatus Limnocylindria bacterium]